jgi:hypothetical protein
MSTEQTSIPAAQVGKFGKAQLSTKQNYHWLVAPLRNLPRGSVILPYIERGGGGGAHILSCYSPDNARIISLPPPLTSPWQM